MYRPPRVRPKFNDWRSVFLWLNIVMRLRNKRCDTPDIRSLSKRNQIDFGKIAFNALDLLPMIRYIKNKFFVFYFFHSVDCYGCLYP